MGSKSAHARGSILNLSSKGRRDIVLALVAIAGLGLTALSTMGGLWTAFKPASIPEKPKAPSNLACGSTQNSIVIGGSVVDSTVRIENDTSC